MLQSPKAERGASRWRDGGGAWRVPLAITLPVGLILSGGMWAAIALAAATLI